MQRYKNLSGDSGVVAFEIHPRALIVQFQDGWKYEYTIKSAGVSTINEMKSLANTGKGLSTFISRQVKRQYARKFH